MFNQQIGIIGLGYVGLPLALAFAEKYRVIGYDINWQRIADLNKGIDSTHEVEASAINQSPNLAFTYELSQLKHCTIFIETVPTPVDKNFQPDLSFLLKASQQIGSILKKGDTVIYESTVYPGCTEEECVPELEKSSGLVFNQDFFVGYSPERINPGDKTRPITSILKITSGSNVIVAEQINALYASVITAGTYLAPSIKVAEAAKAIENAQRDVNISFMNELAVIFDRLNIDTQEVLNAAATKWNFLPFKPGLVGGHCIGVDPHYLAYKAIQVGYTPQVILSGRQVNERMGLFVAEKIIALLAKKYAGNIQYKKVLILGFAFKENCADTRNTKVIDIYKTLLEAGLEVSVYDSLVDKAKVQAEYQIQLIDQPAAHYDAIILALAHEVFQQIKFADYKSAGALIYDAKGVLEDGLYDGRL
ncbi:MAG: nucleotide sugar dehydrogenase [Sphingobacteriia bacterium]|nr:MAG: nucleotide sugar dehydrogenase [Sphingobacteriia bacterium]